MLSGLSLLGPINVLKKELVSLLNRMKVKHQDFFNDIPLIYHYCQVKKRFLKNCLVLLKVKTFVFLVKTFLNILLWLPSNTLCRIRWSNRSFTIFNERNCNKFDTDNNGKESPFHIECKYGYLAIVKYINE